MAPVPSPPCCSPSKSPPSDNHFWSVLRDRVNVILQNPKDSNTDINHCNKMKDDSLLLLKGFDCVSNSLSHISHTIETALQGAKRIGEVRKLENPNETKNSTLKRKRANENPEDEKPGTDSKLAEVKRTAIMVGKMAASLSQELKALRTELSAKEQLCVFLEEENRRLRQDESSTNAMVREEEDDMMRLQMEVLLEEKSRLAGENANLVRENRCLHQMVEYHQMNARSVDEDYDEVMRGICLDFSSPPLTPDLKKNDDVDHRTPKACHSI